eukprot:TRINITY_DN5893_c0_g1_i1.p1 TRINITY_DN5893_c0_g1~~TRINITY_DN5893_c0_g1_i1.p1  ORF type:complete len:571 (-),score=143.43 TRINITY_DN5893_c0_g1_i1:1296-3008(-)
MSTKILIIGVWMIVNLMIVSGFDEASYENSMEVSPNQFSLYWNVYPELNVIKLALKAKTTGWVGFGIGEPTSGSMPGADVMIAQVFSDGQTTISDRYTLEKEEPLIDDCQNWVIIDGIEEDGWTIVEVKRELVTGDVQDRDIVSGNNKIIVAYGSTDDINYHQFRKASGAVFFGENRNDLLEDIKKRDDVEYFDVFNRDYNVPQKLTQYLDVQIEFELEEDVHIIAFEHIITSGTIDIVHHFLLLGGPEYDILKQSQLWGWAPGIEAMVLPEEAGFRAGPSEGSIKIFTMQTHFDNRNLQANLVDNSGVRVYYTKNLREYDAGVMMLGDAIVTNPGNITGSQTFEYTCPEECTSQWEHEIVVFQDFLHMHEIGQRMWSSIYRNDTFIGGLNKIDFWDFAFQQQTPKNITLRPGDRIHTHCEYYTDDTTYFGQGSTDEMCIEYISYYPKLEKGTTCAYAYLSNLGDFSTCGTSILFVDNPKSHDVAFATSTFAESEEDEEDEECDAEVPEIPTAQEEDPNLSEITESSTATAGDNLGDRKEKLQTTITVFIIVGVLVVFLIVLGIGSIVCS